MDPADEFHGPYTYVGNDTVNLVDPNGAQIEEANPQTQRGFDSFI